MDKPTAEVKLTGWKAIAAILAIGGFLLFKLTLQNQSLHTDGVEKITQWLVAEQARKMLPAMEAAMQAPGQNAEALAEMAESVQEDDIVILTVRKHGSGDAAVVRVEYRRTSESASQGNRVRYFRMEHSMGIGWRVQRETDRWAYYLAAF